MAVLAGLTARGRRGLGLAVFVAGLGACASDGPQRATYTVNQGETLYSIAWRYDLEYRRLARWNDIQSPYIIYPGQQLRLNPPLGAPARQAARTAGREPAAKPARAATAALDWRWPVSGDVVNGFSTAGGAARGIDIAGRPGEPIRAASAGKVVYSGGGLAGYGELVILKHEHQYLSAYAHNRKLLVREGDRVRSGQMIAELGSTGAPRPMLHFEIRRAGRPVDPLRHLPPR